MKMSEKYYENCTERVDFYITVPRDVKYLNLPFFGESYVSNVGLKGAMETPQHGNASKKSGNPSKTGFLRRFRNFCRKNGNPSKPSF